MIWICLALSTLGESSIRKQNNKPLTLTDAKEYLNNFWNKHPYSFLTYQNKEWKYIFCGKPSTESIVFLHGGGFDAGMWAYQITELEKHYQIVAPLYKPNVLV